MNFKVVRPFKMYVWCADATSLTFLDCNAAFHIIAKIFVPNVVFLFMARVPVYCKTDVTLLKPAVASGHAL